MSRLVAIARTGLVSVLLHPLRSATILLCLVAILTPYVGGVAVARGVEEQAQVAIAVGADLHVAGAAFGRRAPLPRSIQDRLAAIPGVREVVPRVVGEIAIGKRRVDAIVVGLPVAALPVDPRFVRGRLFAQGARNEFVLGAQLAQDLGLEVGAAIPPFYRNPKGEHVSRIVGVLHGDQPIWTARVIFCSIESATAIFAETNSVSGYLIRCDAGSREAVRTALQRIESPRLVVTSRDELAQALPRSLHHLHGLHHLHFMLALAVAIPLLAVASGVGLSERAREAALLKSLGWTSGEVMVQRTAESLVLSLLGAALAILIAWAWLALLGGRGIASIFLPGAPSNAAFPLPFRMAPVPALLGFLLSFAIVSVGTIYSTWRATSAPPAEVLR